MCTRKSRSTAEARGVLAGLAVLFLAAVFTITGCSTGSNDDGSKGNSTPPPAVTDTTIYTLSGSTFTPYPGTGTAQPVTAQLFDMGGMEDSTPSELGNVGAIAANGKLTLNLPATVPDGKLFDPPAAIGFPAGTKAGYVFFSPSLTLYKSDGSKQLGIIYFNKGGTVTSEGTTVTFAAGWNYFANSTRVTDISSYKWVYETGGGH